MIKAEMIAASRHPITRVKIATMKVVMPRYILAEFNTHRVFSRNSASSRAIPQKKMLASVQANPFIPIAWMKDHSGMQGTEYFTNEEFGEVTQMKYTEAFTKQWQLTAHNILVDSAVLSGLGLTKQIANRLIEPFMYHTVLVTATEYDNFFKLRCPQYDFEFGRIAKSTFKSIRDIVVELSAKASRFQDMAYDHEAERIAHLSPVEILKMNKGQADIHMMSLAEAMWDCYNTANFTMLQPGEWHIPYGDQIVGAELDEAIRAVNADQKFVRNLPLDTVFDADTRNHYLRMISAARCARLSYQTLGEEPKTDLVADIRLHERLFSSGHLSPFEHIGRAMTERELDLFVKTIIDEEGQPVQQKGWCANFNSFIQYRSLIENSY